MSMDGGDAKASSSNDDGSQNIGTIQVRVGTVAELLAQGPAPPCAACTLATTDRSCIAIGSGPTPPQTDGLFFQRGWTVFCSTHKALARSSGEARSSSAPLPRQPKPSQARPQVTSISERWRQQTSLKKKQKKKKQMKSIAIRANSAALGGANEDSPSCAGCGSVPATT